MPPPAVLNSLGSQLRELYEYYCCSGRNEQLLFPRIDEPAWILGVCYSISMDYDSLKEDIDARIWVTYRKNFAPIGNTRITSDRGWGCMLRCGQMMLVQALVILKLGRDWRWRKITRDSIYIQIIRRFEDVEDAIFSIHKIAVEGEAEGKEIGEWFGPNTIAQVLKKLAEQDKWCNISIYVVMDSLIIVDEIKKSYAKKGWKPLILMIPLRLGLAKLNPLYNKGILKCFAFKQSLGILGGTPNHALYFYGCFKDEVLFLDPHTTQMSGSIGNKENEQEIRMDETYHCKKYLRMKVGKMDSSISLCFFCEKEADFLQLIVRIQRDLISTENQPMVSIGEKSKDSKSPEKNIRISLNSDEVD